ncbi:MAG: hypothetical protein M1837_005345 [Sclerophora amabilis]|nr:MAG: hypothetical protein M1837_005345 [Sclerophora amabilis]
MPFKPSLFKSSNRSQASVVSLEQPRSRQSPVESPLPSPGAGQTARSPLSHFPEPTQSDEQEAHYIQQLQRIAEESNQGERPGFPSRSQTQRFPPRSHSYSSSTVNLVGPTYGSGAAETEATRVDDRRPPQTSSSVAEQPPQTTEHRKSKRHFLGFGNHRQHASADGLNPSPPSTARANSGGLGRTISLRRKENPASGRHSHYSPTEQQVQVNWHQGQGAASHLRPSAEQDEEASALDPFLVQSTPHEPLQIITQSPTVYTDQIPQGDQAFRPPVRQSTFPQQQSAYQQNPAPHSQQSQPYQIYPPADSEGHNNHSSAPEQHPPGEPPPYEYHQKQERQSVPYLHQSQQASVSSRPTTPQSQGYLRHSQVSLDLVDHSGHPSSHLQESMGPPPGQPSQTRRAADPTSLSGQAGPPSRDGPNVPGFGQSGQPSNHPPPHGSAQYGPSQGGSGPQGQQYRGQLAQTQHQAQQSLSEHGRSTPPLSRSREDQAGAEISAHQELLQKYSKVKKLYFEKSAQVEQLQNTLAHQRLSQSRTSLDDNEYAARFKRLDGAIGNLSFNIRKDWKTIPGWLQPTINQDAHAKGTKEMTIVGRACISCWIVDMIFDRCFHPGVEPGLSSQLKIIEKNIRKGAPVPQSMEEEDALLSKVLNWRLTTIDGLYDSLSRPEAMDHRNQLTRYLVDDLVAELQKNLVDPPPPGLDGGVSGIIELAVGIAANLPLESREVFVEYPRPGTLVVPEKSTLESGLPPLANSGVSLDDAGKEKTLSADGGDLSGQPGDSKDHGAPLKEARESDGSLNSNGLKDQPQKKKSMFGGLMGKKPPQSMQGSEPIQKQEAASGSQSSLGLQSQTSKDEPKRVRVAAFMAVEVRGRSVLVSAPVWTL